MERTLTGTARMNAYGDKIAETERVKERKGWMFSTRRMHARIVTSGKCWSGVEEKMPEISRKVNRMDWLRNEDVFTLQGGKLASILKI